MILRTVTPLLVAAVLFIGALAAQAVERRAPLVPVDNASNAAKVALGRRLFYDGDLSIDGTMSCATCHLQHRGFAEGQRAHPGVTGEPGRRNVPGLANVAWRKIYTWGDASLRTLEAQALVPMLGEHPVELGMKGQQAELARRLGTNACYPRLFRVAFPETGGRIDTANVTRALASFQRSLVSTNAPADRFAAGDEAALSTLARNGATLFKRACASCHSGPDFTDDRFHRVAVGAVDPRDRGLGEITGRARDNGRFRTPSLRNISVAAPYFHDGDSPTLEAAIQRHRGIALRQDEDMAVVAYLEAMTDQSFLSDSRLAYPDNPCEAD